MFDFYIESAVVGKRYVFQAQLASQRLGLSTIRRLTCLSFALNRKPDPEFYQHALDLLKVQASEVVFLDDIGPNLKAAQKLGITTIRECHLSFRARLACLKEKESAEPRGLASARFD